MSCYYPRLAVDYGIKEDGKHLIKFIPQRADYNINNLRNKFGRDLLLLPCGQCLGCKFDRASDWAVRSVLEASMYEENCFLTLTYKDTCCPPILRRSDLKEFFKKLRNRGVKFRYLACGEYGSRTHRPHYHAIIFGFKPDDLVFYKKSGENSLYISQWLTELWAHGYVIVGDVSFESAGYVARYTTKKLGDDNSFIMMSNRPGLARDYLTAENMRSMLDTGMVYGRFGKAYKLSIPRYFHPFLEAFDKEAYSRLMSDRINSIRLVDDTSLFNLRYGNLEQLKVHQAQILDDKLKVFDRSIYD